MKQQGFTLLEAIVAMVIFSFSAMAIYSLVSGNILSLIKSEAVMEEVNIRDDIVSYITSVNIHDVPEGEKQLGKFTFDWQAVLTEPIRKGTNRYGQLGLYDIGLYKVSVEVYKGPRRIARFDFLQAGFVRVREPQIL